MDATGQEAALHARLGAIVEHTRRLVEIDSPSDAPAGVERVARLLAEPLAAAGCTVTLQPLAGFGPLLDARLELGSGPTVLVLGHADTVWPVGTAAGWPFRAAGGRLEGPGVGDMKCCLATAVAVIELVARERPPGLGAVHFLVVPDEEQGSVASRPAIERAARAAAACLTLEAARPGGGVVVARGAVGALRIAATGDARHVTDPAAGASALRPLAALVDPIERLGDRARGVQASCGVLRAGSARQVVPGSGELLVDLRAPSTAEAEQLAAAVRALAAAVDRPAGVEVLVEGGVTRPAAPRSAGVDALLTLARSAAAALGAPLHEVVERGGSDACFPAALGVPTLDGLGPIAHDSCSPAEWVEEASIPVWGAILASLVAHAGGVR